MNIAIDSSPLQSIHKVRGTGFYLEHLKKSLLKYYPNHHYNFFVRGEKLLSNIDILHFPYFEPFFLTLPQLKKYKTIVTVHDLTPIVFPSHFPSGIKGKIKWQIQKKALKKVDAIITDSNSSKKDIIQYTHISPEKIHVIYLAAGEEFKKLKDKIEFERVKKTYNLPDKFVLYVGDATWNKNLPRLIQAVQQINTPLVMVGKAVAEKSIDRKNPWNKDLLETQRLIQEDKKNICLGFIPAEDLVLLYNMAAVFIMPSLYEGFGLPILEAMACGCPVITSKEGSLKEVAGNAAFYVDAYDIKSIEKGIETVFRDDNIQKKLSQEGAEQIKKFLWKKTAQETIAVYKEVFIS